MQIQLDNSPYASIETDALVVPFFEKAKGKNNKDNEEKEAQFVGALSDIDGAMKGRLASLADPTLKQITTELGKTKNGISEKARRLLGWAPRSREDALVATAESLARLGLLKGRS